MDSKGQDITQDTEVSSDIIHTTGEKPRYDFMIKENALSGQQMGQLNGQQAMDQSRCEIEKGHLMDQYHKEMNEVKGRVKVKMTEYIREISDLENERQILLKELGRAHSKLQEVYGKLKQVGETGDSSYSKEMIKGYRDAMKRMDVHYRKQITSATNVIKQYREKFEGLKMIIKVKDHIIEQFSSKLDLLTPFCDPPQNTRDMKESEMEKNYETLKRRHHLLLRAYEVLADKFESTNRSMSKYRELCTKDKGDVLKVLQNCIISKDNQLELVQAEIDLLRRECLAKDEIIGTFLKRKLEEEEDPLKVDFSKKVKVIAYNVGHMVAR
ncbi:hypothetical protein FOA43_000924 [Brettanomyces nanus]|uniref:Uncharacterized protein n=1 Tax=Eeniella nana TaxID=13502 RepID=A0A875S0G7_EENNA|nr:uncharacterized protein FOA43_000924 [Brettanomyces nanus]QPG73612.1 hypothetical protein FOA43_000924 [Brettanomyces nanus]